MAVKIRLKRMGKIRQPVLPRRRRRLPQEARRQGHRGDRQVPPQGGALVHRGRLRPGAVLARRRRAAVRGRRGASSRSPVTGRSSRACRAPRAPCAPGAQARQASRSSTRPSRTPPTSPRARPSPRRPPPRRPQAPAEEKAEDAARPRRRPRLPRTRPRRLPPRRPRGACRRGPGRRGPGRGARPPRPPTRRPRPDPDAGRRSRAPGPRHRRSTPTTSPCATSSCAAGRSSRCACTPTDLGKVIGRGGRTATALPHRDRLRSPAGAAPGSTSSTSTGGAEPQHPAQWASRPRATLPMGTLPEG